MHGSLRQARGSPAFRSAGWQKGCVAYLCVKRLCEGAAPFAHVKEIASGLRKRGWRVDIHAPSATGSERGIIRRIYESLHTQMRLWISSTRIDILYVRAHFPTVLSVIWARLRGIPVVVENNGPFEDVKAAWPGLRVLAPIFKLTALAQLRLATAVVTVTPQLKRYLRNEFGCRRVEVIPNGANPELFAPGAPADLAVPGPYAIFVGALSSWQGISSLLAATRDPIWPTGLRLIVVGDGLAKAKVAAEAAKNALVVWLGTQPYREIPGLVANSLAALSPKDGQSGMYGLSPLKVFEALSCGVPVVVTDFPGMADLVRRHECGLVVPPGDSEAIAGAMAYLYEHPAEASEMGRRGRTAVLREYSWDKRAADTDRLLCKLARRG